MKAWLLFCCLAIVYGQPYYNPYMDEMFPPSRLRPWEEPLAPTEWIPMEKSYVSQQSTPYMSANPALFASGVVDNLAQCMSVYKACDKVCGPYNAPCTKKCAEAFSVCQERQIARCTPGYKFCMDTIKVEEVCNAGLALCL